MSETSPEVLSERLRADEDDLQVLDIRREEPRETLATDVPDHPPNFQRVKRVNVEADEQTTLEFGPSRFAAE